MTVPVLSAARYLARKSGWGLSNLELQKILYLAHMFHMGRHDGQPLVPGSFEAWEYGPVHPTLYKAARVFGSSDVQDIFHGSPDIPDGGPEKAILDEAYDSLAHLTAGQLVSATHRKGGAWYQNYIPGHLHCIIPNADILSEYRSLGRVGR